MHSGTLYQYRYALRYSVSVPLCTPVRCTTTVMHSGTLYQYRYALRYAVPVPLQNWIIPVALLTILVQSQKVGGSFIQEVKAAEA